MDAEVEVGTEVEVGADSPLVHNTYGRSDRLAYVIYTTCRSCYLIDRDNAKLDTLPSIIYSWLKGSHCIFCVYFLLCPYHFTVEPLKRYPDK